MASGAAKVAYGASLGTGADLNVRTVGFRPRKVEIVNVDSADELYWTEGMADDTGVKRLAAGAASIISSLGITPLSDGFKIGADTDINVATQTMRWVATE